jgi:hypothetical protein
MKWRKSISILFFNFSLQLILGEEVALSKLTLMEIISKICDGVQARAKLGLYSSLIVMLQQLVGKKVCTFGWDKFSKKIF